MSRSRQSTKRLRRTVSISLTSAAAALVILFSAGSSSACVGVNCLQIWSTEEDGGALAIEWDVAKKVQTFKSFCTTGNTSCLYTNVDPGFIANADAVPGSGYFPLVDGTRVLVEIVDIAPELTMSLNGVRLDEPNEQGVVGTHPDIHNHPQWQLLVPGDDFGDYEITIRLREDGERYADSDDLTLVVTNLEPTPVPGTPTATATATPTPQPPPCDGDCGGDGAVTVDEVLTCVNLALGMDADCPACDIDGSQAVTVDEIITALAMALNGCPLFEEVTLAEIQDEIFTPRCALPLCHDSASMSGNLVLTDGVSHGELVNVVPEVPLAAQAGQLRVDPGDPSNSFLIVKLIGPPPGNGSPMPLLGDLLRPEEIQKINNWILQGALP
jgi:hypothetical protein